MFNNTTLGLATEDDPSPGSSVFLPSENFSAADTPDVGRLVTFEDIKAACAECKAYGGGEGFFGRQWNDRLVNLLLPSYKTLRLVGDDPHLLAYLISQSGVDATKRTRKNPALVCVKITARPRDTAQMKLCSTWAVILNEADAANISVEGFAEWVKTKFERRPRSEKTEKRAEASRTEETSQSKLGAETLSLLASIHSEVRDVVKMPGSDIERLQWVIASLQARLDDLKAIQEGPNASLPLQTEAEVSPATSEVADD